jgi:hypothetical protein
MHYLHRILLSNFFTGPIQCKEISYQELIFFKHKLFYTISLLQEQRLNPKNYSKEELIMEIYAGDNLLLVPTRPKHALHPKEVLPTEDRLARPSPWVTSFFLPHDSLGVGERDFGQMVTQLHQLTGPISPACDRYVQYLLAGPTHWFLTDIGGGYSLKGIGFPHTTL